jgi:hypothetical protein
LITAGSTAASNMPTSIQSKITAVNLTDTNWSAYLTTGAEFPVVIKSVASAANTTALELLNQSFTCSTYAIYPFIYKTANSSASKAPRRAETITASDGYSITAQRTKTSATATNDFSMTVSGVESVAADQDLNAPVEYYTISGIRVVGTPAPGIYIRRQGNTVSKVAIR